ncbi:16S rRNA methyltransferase, partial [Thioclava sp. BHET1]
MRETDQTSEATAGLAARRAALALLSGVLLEGRMLSELTADAGGPLARLAPEDRARAQRLALSVLRHLEQAEAHLDPYLRKTPPAAVKLALCLAVVEVFAEGAAAHGAVNAAVALVRKMKGGAALAGLTNAVLRKAVAVPVEDWQARPASRVPGWLRAS